MVRGRREDVLDEQPALQGARKQAACRHDDRQDPGHHSVFNGGLTRCIRYKPLMPAAMASQSS